MKIINNDFSNLVGLKSKTKDGLDIEIIRFNSVSQLLILKTTEIKNSERYFNIIAIDCSKEYSKLNYGLIDYSRLENTLKDLGFNVEVLKTKENDMICQNQLKK